jgi:hypothetical protein
MQEHAEDAFVPWRLIMIISNIQQDQRLEADLIALLDEMAASLAQEGRNV